MKYIEERLAKIEQRNTNVELNKAWEVSWTRRLTIMLMTYIVVALILSRIHYAGALYDALIPACGYLLSTLTLPPLKSYWIKKQITNGIGNDDKGIVDDKTADDEIISSN